VLTPVEAVVGARLVGKTAAIGQHAPVREVARAAHEVREAKADALLSVGGGSPIDAAKAVAWSLAAGGGGRGAQRCAVFRFLFRFSRVFSSTFDFFFCLLFFSLYSIWRSPGRLVAKAAPAPQSPGQPSVCTCLRAYCGLSQSADG